MKGTREAGDLASRRGVLLPALFVVQTAILAACAPVDLGEIAGAKGATAKGGAAVVADISAGTNPYHETFRRPGWDKPPCKTNPAIPCDLPRLDLTLLGIDYATSLAADVAVWAAYRPGTVYWVPGTNLLLLTLRSVGPALCSSGSPCGFHDGYVDAGFDHGVATSGAMANACPDCYVLVIQDAPSYDGSAVEHVATQLPWVDVVSQTNLSGYGTNPFSVFDVTLLDKTVLLQPFQQATRDLAGSGRLLFAASGDYAVAGTPGPDLPALGYDYPPWVVPVGGMTAESPFPDAVEKTCNAIEVLSGTPAEMLGDFLLSLPVAGTVDEYAVQGGTSFAAPQLAARFAEALAGVRARLGDERAPGVLWAGKTSGSGVLRDGTLTAEEMRGVFATSARYFQPTDFNAACVAEMSQSFIAIQSAPTPERPASATPWLDMGWGYVGPDETALATRVILGDAVAPDKPVEATVWMNAFMSARQAAFPTP